MFINIYGNARVEIKNFEGHLAKFAVKYIY